MHDIDGSLPDGSVKQDGLNFRQRPLNPSEAAAHIPYPVTGQVTAIYAIDDDKNRDEETVLLDVRCEQLGIDLFKVPWIAVSKGSVDNYIHHSPVPATGRVDKKPFDSLRIDPSVSNGDTVLVVFANANVHQPYAIAVLPHNQTEKSSPEPRPKKDDGDVYKVRFNGMNFLIDKDGNVRWWTNNTFDEKIPKKKKFEIDLNEDGKTQRCKVEIDNTGEGKFLFTVTKEDGKLNQMLFDAQNNRLKFLNQSADGDNFMTMDDAGIEINSAKDYTLTVAGNQTFNITGDYTMNASAKLTINSTDDFKINASAKFEVSATGEAKITSTAKATVAGQGGTDVGSGSSPTNVLGATVALAGGGAPVARIGDMVIGTGNLGAPVVSQIVQGSPKVTSA